MTKLQECKNDIKKILNKIEPKPNAKVAYNELLSMLGLLVLAEDESTDKQESVIAEADILKKIIFNIFIRK